MNNRRGVFPTWFGFKSSKMRRKQTNLKHKPKKRTNFSTISRDFRKRLKFYFYQFLTSIRAYKFGLVFNFRRLNPALFICYLICPHYLKIVIFCLWAKIRNKEVKNRKQFRFNHFAPVRFSRSTRQRTQKLFLAIFFVYPVFPFKVVIFILNSFYPDFAPKFGPKFFAQYIQKSPKKLSQLKETAAKVAPPKCPPITIFRGQLGAAQFFFFRNFSLVIKFTCSALNRPPTPNNISIKKTCKIRSKLSCRNNFWANFLALFRKFQEGLFPGAAGLPLGSCFSRKYL
ncbi:hypothetical protein PPERSA_03656 [Pseudocohnilembus persalinus]|uniref:Uncharacterized protein n=1 Tax=Pseudocohnilembus persalinus TaxID=266149 RepID=A0A0V0QMY4_PSEPJ|nr:hypothetical protein PPERSA_03656 [Pseudocohnilembus persalinus]|eukprot:KRX03695.1 hypothetical protein PPERSA_03656 [Pseudocohnilembus persalinus]